MNDTGQHESVSTPHQNESARKVDKLKMASSVMSGSPDNHVIKNNGTSQIKTRFHTLIEQLDPSDSKSDSDDSILDFMEWDEILEPIPSLSQVVSRTHPQAASKFSNCNGTMSSELPCDQSCDLAQPVSSNVSGGHNYCENHMTSSRESHDQSWDIAPLTMSGPCPPNENGLIQVHVSEVHVCINTYTSFK